MSFLGDIIPYFNAEDDPEDSEGDGDTREKSMALTLDQDDTKDEPVISDQTEDMRSKKMPQIRRRQGLADVRLVQRENARSSCGSQGTVGKRLPALRTIGTVTSLWSTARH